MHQVAKFLKVSLKQFIEDTKAIFPNLSKEDIKSKYDSILLPKRATTGSAGYDILTPFDVVLKPQESIRIPTGLRVQINEGWLLQCYPKSSHGFKYRLQLDNTVGIIDSDYFNANNEGHIMVQITNDSNQNKIVEIKENKAFCQGIFVSYGITIDDEVEDVRVGGFGSTKK